MSQCPECSGPVTYAGLVSVECATFGCANYGGSQGKRYRVDDGEIVVVKSPVTIYMEGDKYIVSQGVHLDAPLNGRRLIIRRIVEDQLTVTLFSGELQIGRSALVKENVYVYWTPSNLLRGSWWTRPGSGGAPHTPSSLYIDWEIGHKFLNVRRCRVGGEKSYFYLEKTTQ